MVSSAAPATAMIPPVENAKESLRSSRNTREELLAATMRVVGRRGLAGLTNRIVAEEAGVTHGLVRHYFGSRDELVREAFREAVCLSTQRAVIETGTGSLDDFGAGLGSVVAAEPEQQAFQYEMLLAALRRPDLLEDVRQTYSRFFTAVGDELDLAGFDEPNDALARLVFAALDGLVLQQLLYNRPGDTERAIIRLRELLKAARDARAAVEK